MHVMRLIALTVGLLLLNSACAVSQASPPAEKPSAQPADQPAVASRADLKPLNPQSTIDDILDALDARGKNLKDFQADLKLADVNNATGLATERSGTAKFARPPEGNARMLVTFDTRKINEQASKPEKTQYLLDPPWLIERDYRRRQEIRRKVLREGEKLNLLKLGEGPFPLPIGQDKASVHELFEVKKVEAAADDPAGTAHIQLLPKAGTPFSRKYKTIDVWVDQKSNMPVRIAVVDKGGDTTQTTDLSNVRINVGLTDADFKLPPVPEGWERHEETYQE